MIQRALTCLFLLMGLIQAGVLPGRLVAAEPATEELPAAPLESELDRVSYSIGASIGRNMKENSIEINPQLLLQGILDSLRGKLKLTEKEMMETMQAFQQRAAQQQATRIEGMAQANETEGQAFLAKNKTAEGVVTLPSGLQYKVLRAGKGPKPKATDTVSTHYEGRLIDGTVFDSSIDADPVSFPVGGVIAGWTEALQLMPVGSKWQLFIPGSLAYGKRGAPPRIGPNQVLIFDIELLKIE